MSSWSSRSPRSSFLLLRPAPRLLQLRRELQLPQRVVPHPLENLAYRTRRLRLRAIEAVAVLGAGADESRLGQRSQVEGDGAEGDVGHRVGDGARGELALPYEAQDLAAPRRRDGLQHGMGGNVHA